MTSCFGLAIKEAEISKHDFKANVVAQRQKDRDKSLLDCESSDLKNASIKIIAFLHFTNVSKTWESCRHKGLHIGSRRSIKKHICTPRLRIESDSK